LLRHKTTLRLAITLALAILMLGFPNIRSPAEESGGFSSDGSSSIEKLFAPVLVWQSQPGFRVGNFSSAIRNLVAATARKHEIEAETAEIHDNADESVTALPIKFKAANTGGGISIPSLSVSRFTGFTQSETSAAWCGNSVLIAFNDTAAEITTLAAGSGISSIGFSNSSNLRSSRIWVLLPSLRAPCRCWPEIPSSSVPTQRLSITARPGWTERRRLAVSRLRSRPTVERPFPRQRPQSPCPARLI
jgi:hypothetical protein